MPSRILKETVKLSEQIDSLSWFEEVLFYRLLVSVDDYGCIDGRATVLKNTLFPTKENVTRKAVEDGIQRMVSVGLLHRYEVNDMPYLLFPTWEKHQRIRNKTRKCPPPLYDIQNNDSEYTFDSKLPSNDGQMTADCLLEIESKKNPSIYPLTCPPTGTDKGETEAYFAAFWAEYPKKQAKSEAHRAFVKLKADKTLLDTLLSALRMQKASQDWLKDGGRYVPLPATWLNGKRWEDEVKSYAEPKKGRHGRIDYEQHDNSGVNIADLAMNFDSDIPIVP